MTLNAIIADDEALSVEMLQIVLSEIAPYTGNIEIAAVCTNGNDTLDAVRAMAPDLLFLDINMPGRDGMSVVEDLVEIGGTLPQVIFTTAHAEYAARAFDLEAVDYLLKPIRADRLQRALERARDLRRTASRAVAVKHVAVPVVGGVEILKVDAIDWVEACGDYIKIHINDRQILIRTTLSSFAKEVEPVLRQTHRSYLVNTDRVERIVPKQKGEALLYVGADTEIPVSRRHRDVLVDLMK